MSRVLNPTKRWDRLIAKIRLWEGFCPRCNSDAPAIDDCWVCNEGRLGGNGDRSILERRWESWKP